MSWKKFVYASDVHGDCQDAAAVAALHKFCDIWKPTIRVMGGDLWDFRAIRKGASEEERRDSMLLDYSMGWEFLDTFKPTVFLLGNHDSRIYNISKDNKGLISDYAKQCVNEIGTRLGKMKCRVFEYDRRAGVYQLGDLKMVHGFGAGGKTTTRTHATAYGRVLLGHTHSIDSFNAPALSGGFAMTAGCLCKLDMDYLHASLGSLAHQHGFIYGAMSERTKECHVWQAKCVSGEWLLPTGLAVL